MRLYLEFLVIWLFWFILGLDRRKLFGKFLRVSDDEGEEVDGEDRRLR